MLVFQIAAGILLALILWRAWRVILMVAVIMGLALYFRSRPSPPPIARIDLDSVLFGLGGVIVFMLPVVGFLVWRDRRREKTSAPSAKFRS